MNFLCVFWRRCRWILPLWAAFLVLVAGLAAFELHVARTDGEQRLAEEARRIARRSGEILALPAWRMDEVAARSIIMTEMEDERIYGMAVYDLQGLLEGQRRDEQWESVPWDDLLPDAMVEGVFPLTLEERPVGTVKVYLAPRRLEENLSALWRREALRALALAGAATLLLGWVARRRMRAPDETETSCAEECVSGSEPSSAAESPPPPDLPEKLPGLAVHETVLPEKLLGLAVHETVRRMGGQVETYLLLVELFRRLYGGGPQLLLRLAAGGDVERLGRLAGSLKKAARGLGAEALESAVALLEDALRGQPSAVARRAEACAAALEEVLESARTLC